MDDQLVTLAKKIAYKAHASSFRRGSRVPYIKHPQDVAQRVSNDRDMEVVAWLHDIFEESNKTPQFLVKAGIPQYLVDEIVLLTFDGSISYDDYIKNISKSNIATKVKIADMLSNLSETPTVEQIRKYSKALLKLTTTKKDNNNSTIDYLLLEITEGLKAHDRDPIGWLNSFIYQLNDTQLNGIVAEKSDIPPNIRLLDHPPVALVVDCGTGETKMLLYKMEKDIATITEVVKIESATSYVDNPDVFIKTIRYFFSKNDADIVLIAASAWLRNASPEILKKGNELLQQLVDTGMLCKILSQREEAWYEIISVEYVCNKLNIEGITATWASGAGSTQITQYFSQVYPFMIGNSRGKKLIESEVDSGVKLWRDEVKRAFSSSKIKLSGCILCMSAVCHAAIVCGIDLNKAVSVKEVRKKFNEYIDYCQQKEELSGDDVWNLSNVIQHLQTIEEIVLENADLFFIRDIKIGNFNLRVTWSFGWYLELLNGMNLLSSYRSLERFHNDKVRLAKLANEYTPELNTSNVSAATAGQVLLDIQQTAEILLLRSKETENIVTSLMQEIAQKTQSRLEGLEYRFKTHKSLIRKLKLRLRSLINSNAPYRLYIPRLKDVFNEVDDVLRYTVVTNNESYTKTVTVFLETLKNKLNCTYKCFSFWSASSTYFGINSFVTISGFTFEIQFHTNESWEVKQNESHEIYEGFRLLPKAGLAKLILYENMKKIWRSTPIPSDINSITPPEPMLNQLMEQVGRIYLLRKRIKELYLDNNDNGKSFFVNDIFADTNEYMCYRLIRGREPEEFKYLAYPSEVKRLSWVASGDNLSRLLSTSKENKTKTLADCLGKPLAWIEQKIADGYFWKLAIIPKEYCIIADWDGVFFQIRTHYPEITAKVMRYKEQLIKTDFYDIERQIEPSNSFRDIKDKGLEHPQYMNVHRLSQIPEPKLWHIRGFLYNIIGLNELYKGDGIIYNESGEKQDYEFLTKNCKIEDIEGSFIFEID